MRHFKDKRGFTMIELMIVVAIIGILASVVMTKFNQMIEKAREGATKGNIGSIRSAIAIYYGNQQGVWPGDLSDSIFANYLGQIPAVKVMHPKSIFLLGNPLSGTNNSVLVTNLPNGGETYAATGDGWLYNAANGNVFVNNNQSDTSSTIYTMYGYQ